MKQFTINNKTVNVVVTRLNGGLGAAVNCITEKEMVVYNLRKEGKTYKEIAVIVGLSSSRVMTMYNRAVRTAERFGK